MRLSYHWHLILGTFLIFAARGETRETQAWPISYYGRNLNGPVYSMLCFTTRNSDAPLLFGHSALSEFRLARETSRRGKLLSFRVRTVAHHPMRARQYVGSQWKFINLLYDALDDHFLMFARHRVFTRNSRHCVPITQGESIALWDWLDMNREKKWSLSYNCNDLAMEAFARTTSIEFSNRPLTILAWTAPGKVMAAVRRYQSLLKPEGEFIYAPRSPRETERIEELESKYLAPRSSTLLSASGR